MDIPVKASLSISFSNQREADEKLSAINELNLEKIPDGVALLAEPLTEKIDIASFLDFENISYLSCSGDNADDGSVLDFDWVLDLRRQCILHDIPFYFTSTGANFRMRGRDYHIGEKFRESQAAKADVHYFPVSRAFNPPVFQTTVAPTSSVIHDTDTKINEAPSSKNTNTSCVQESLNFEDSNPTDENFESEHTIPVVTSEAENISIPGINYEIEIDPEDRYIDELFNRISHSKFRSSFHLREQERSYCLSHSEETIKQHAMDFVSKKLAPAEPENDGKQTPMKGHPVFIAQHATACCCRGCLHKWHHVPEHRPLTESEQQYIVKILLSWIRNDMRNSSTEDS
ncbi:protein of unknown function [Oribacterium sp. KHPX15]|uniref:DUF4186 family protein n=1 Tax=Oribacterium sp. KHPX15 TaxID=1855342 RepID=UPI000895B8C9|nr:DUF4186 family protein [Oribacterium sp. KHPX15]SDZ86969.1 protein of unknown function [Oribacterium sp. KHPX15]